MSLTFSEWMKLQYSHKVYAAEIELLASGGNKTLRVASESIVLGGNFYDGRIQQGSIPTFSRSIKNLDSGGGQISYGGMTLVNADGGLDDDLDDYNWIGADVTVKYGGTELDFSNYETVIRAYIRGITITDISVALSLSDRMLTLLRKKIAAKTWNGSKIYTMVDDILTECGISSSDRDSTLWTQFETDANMTGYLETDGTEDATTLLDKILHPLMFWYGFSRAGMFQVALLTTASSSDYDILEDVEEMTFSLKPFDKHYWKINLSYISTTPSTKTTISQSDSTIKTVYPLAMESNVKDTVLDNSTDANTTLTRWWNMFSARRWVLTTGLTAQGFALGVGDAFSLSRTRYDLSGNWRIVSLNENFETNTVTIEGLQ